MKTIDNKIARALVLVVSLIWSFPIFGQNDNAVDLNLARRVCENFIKMNSNIKLSGELAELRLVEIDKFSNLYIFRVNDKGLVVVAGDKRVPPILCFSEDCLFDSNNISPTLEMLINNHNEEIEHVKRQRTVVHDNTISYLWNKYNDNCLGNNVDDRSGPLDFLIKKSWHQGNKKNWSDNYNQDCPWKIQNNDTIKAIAGCVPVAMAQLLYYHHVAIPEKTINHHFYHRQQNVPLKIKKENTTFQSTYFDKSNVCNGQLPTPIGYQIGNWDYSLEETKLAAKIIRDCGVVVDCQYGLEASGAWSVPICTNIPSAYDAFKEHFGFPNAIYGPISKSKEPEISFMLRKYIIKYQRPIYISGNDATSPSLGHAYLLDGYMEGTNDKPRIHYNIGDGSPAGFWDYLYALYNYNHKHYIILEPIEECKPGSGYECLNSSNSKDNQTNNGVIYESITKYYEYMDAMSYFVANAIKDAYWEDEQEGMEFWNSFQSLLNTNTGMISEEGIEQLINQYHQGNLSEEYIRSVAEGYNQSVLYWNEGYYINESLPDGYGGMIEYDTAAMRKAYEAQAYAESLGFSDVRQMYDNAYEMLEAEVGNQQTSVCASVTIQISQKASMTREAFNGTLQIFNGHESIPMQNILVDFRIEDQQGNDCTNLFQINTLSLDQITGISGDGSLAAQTNGTALVQFIPTRNAAPTEPVVYSFGGSFSFIDPFTGEGLTYPLYPVDITVNPSPDFNIDYFMQRDILGDDALTSDVIEHSVPAELGVIINNKGAGMAKNVILETAEPQIVDNEKGLAISFTMCGSYLNGIERQLGLHGIPFGNIEAGQKVVAEWLFTSSLLGHFISYEANVVHNSSYGNQDLSLISHLELHELIHPIYAYGNLDDGINDFLVNDTPDAYDTPDSIYFSHGGKTSVSVVDGISYDHLVSRLDTIVTLTVVPSRIGWNYGVTDDPGRNQYDIVSCIRNNDNQEIPLNNVWLTFVTIPDGGDPVYENKLHIVDTIPVQQTTTYTLVFSKKPSNLRIFNGNVDTYWSNAENWEGNIIPQADDEVLINGICQLDEDVEVFSLTVAENQSLTIPAGRILTTSGTLANEAVSRLIIEDGGQLVHRNEGVQATVKKDIAPYTSDDNGWNLIASPLVGITNVAAVPNMLSNNYDLYYYNEPTHYWINQEDAANNFTELVNGKGYLYANSESVVLEFPGTLRSGNTTVMVPLFYTENNDLAGFNLVGNPFVYNLTSYASHNVANGCFQLNEDGSDLIVSEISETNPLKPAEGFFVKATGEGASVTFSPSRGTTAGPSGSIYVELLDKGKLIDRLIVKVEGEPLEKLSLNETRSKVFAMQGRHEVAIVPCEGNEQPVRFKAAKNGTYTINVYADKLEFDYLHLIDNLTGADVDLLVEPSYTFEANMNDYASRFRLVFSVSGDDNGHDTPFAYINNGNIVINGAEAGAVLQIVDMTGRVLVCRDASNASVISTTEMVKGVYILRLINGDEVRTQKMVVK